MAELRWEGLSAGCGLLVGSELFPLCHAHLSASGGHRFSLRSELKLWSEIGKGGKKKKSECCVVFLSGTAQVLVVRCLQVEEVFQLGKEQCGARLG